MGAMQRFAVITLRRELAARYARIQRLWVAPRGAAARAEGAIRLSRTKCGSLTVLWPLA
jgi:hypothetical protein